jgi:hypothetical protein
MTVASDRHHLLLVNHIFHLNQEGFSMTTLELRLQIWIPQNR